MKIALLLLTVLAGCGVDIPDIQIPDIQFPADPVEYVPPEPPARPVAPPVAKASCSSCDQPTFVDQTVTLLTSWAGRCDRGGQLEDCDFQAYTVSVDCQGVLCSVIVSDGGLVQVKPLQSGSLAVTVTMTKDPAHEQVVALPPVTVLPINALRVVCVYGDQPCSAAPMPAHQHLKVSFVFVSGGVEYPGTVEDVVVTGQQPDAYYTTHELDWSGATEGTISVAVSRSGLVGSLSLTFE